MKKHLKYCLPVIMLMLFNITAMKAAYTPDRFCREVSQCSYISQAQANRNAARILYLIYSHTPREAVSTDNQTFDIKTTIRLLTKTDVSKNVFQPTHLPDEYTYSHVHPDAVGYYIFMLKKIVI